MPLTLRQCVRIGYHSAAVAYSAARTKHEIADRRAANQMKARRERDRVAEPDPYFRDQRCALWLNMAAANNYAMRFFNQGRGIENAAGVRVYLEDIWVNELGRNLNQLDTWDDYAQRNLKTPLAFESRPQGPRISAYEDAFTGNKNEITAGDPNFVQLYKEMFDLTVNDIWAAEGMRRWLNNQLTRTGEPAGALAKWDNLVNGSKDFFDNAMHCVEKMAENFTQYQNDRRGDLENVKLKYRWGPANRYLARGGLYSCDAGQLTANERQTEWVLENRKITFQ